MAAKKKSMFGRRRRGRVKTLVFCLFSALTIIVCVIMAGFDDKVMPPILAIVEKTARNRINVSIDDSIQKAVKETGLSSSDLYDSTTDSEGMIISLSVNTVLVNELCGRLAVDVSRGISETGPETVKIPVGTLLDMQAFSNVGPTFPITVQPVGNAAVDYETAFESVGINQINFQLWLKIDSYVRVANPVQDRDILVSRRVALVNTVFSGKVPDTYLNNMPVSVPTGNNTKGGVE